MEDKVDYKTDRIMLTVFPLIHLVTLNVMIYWLSSSHNNTIAVSHIIWLLTNIIKSQSLDTNLELAVICFNTLYYSAVFLEKARIEKILFQILTKTSFRI